MSTEERDVQTDRYLDAIRAEAWSEHVYPRTAVNGLAEPPLEGAFARVVAVYERELCSKLDERAAVARGASNVLKAVSDARDIAYEMLSQLVSGPERSDVERIVAELDKVLGPDLVREADPEGLVLKPLPFEDRKRMLDALDLVQDVVEERGGQQPPMIVIVEDEMGPILDRMRQRREQGEGA